MRKRESRYHNNRRTTVITVIAVIFVLALFVRQELSNKSSQAEIPGGVCEFHFVDVGQGDCSLFVTEDSAVLIDAGPKSAGEKTAEYVSQHAEAVEYFILTHPDEDHIGGAVSVINSVKVDNIIMSDAVKDTYVFNSLLDAIENSEINIIRAVPGSEYRAGEMKIAVLAPIGEFDDYNDYSVVTRIEYGATSAIVTGDAEKGSEKLMTEKYGSALRSDVLKLAHHGSSTSTGEEFFRAVSPQYAVISCGKDNSYGHPHGETLELLNKYGVKYYRTDLEGSIVFVSDGENVTRR